MFSLKFNQTTLSESWRDVLRLDQNTWTGMSMELECMDMLLVASLLVWILWQLAFLSNVGRSLDQKKEFSIYLCETAASVCLIATFFPIFRLTVLNSASLFNETFKIGVFFTTIFVLWNSPQFIKQHPRRPVSEYAFFIISGLLFLFLLIEADDFITLFFSLVGFSVTLYVLIMMFWSDSKGYNSRHVFQGEKKQLFDPFEQAHEASLKYFYLSAFSSSLILLSIALFYTIAQTLSFDEIRLVLSRQAGISGFDGLSLWKPLFEIGLTLYTLGFAFKLSAFPSHFWAPEVYQGAASPVTAFIIMPVKIGVFAIFARTLMTSFGLLHDLWGPLLLIFGLGSLIVGAFSALTERVFKKFVAYSSINQIGYVLTGLSTGQITGLQTVLFFFLIYILTTVALFSVFLNLKNKVTNMPIQYVSDLGFLSPHEWLPRVALTVVFFSLAGLPPFAGFFSKFYVLLHLFEEGYLFAVLIGILTSLISSYYYLTLINYMWFGSIPKASFEKNRAGFPIFRTEWKGTSKFVLGVILLFLSAFLCINQEILTFSQQLAYSCAYSPNTQFYC